MSQNRNNNRRRGRNNRGPGGGNQGNRIDSRARGNAPQMLEKYKKLAHDASLNGDRVQTEYYLQFADHYFRVIADIKTQKDEQQRSRGNNDRDDDDNDDDDGEDERQSRDDRGGSQRGRRNRDDRDNDGDRGQQADEASDKKQDESEGDNPFVRDSKPRRGRPRKKADDSDSGGLDPSSLPPAIGKDNGSQGEDNGQEERPRRRTRSRRPSGDEEALEAHG
ncbi:DUF4167 domain-containing protein [Croceibacterium aestuarii]|uniref:DUF4167 domain-containing protein n=1 Tax=Croceibacterium aestuarii TaxID=3064139 RepID=UPI00272DDCF2|nr:DUF4167 domain-containing protein [Croceibacterium sp. D39]